MDALEIVIVDNGSTDNSKVVIEEFASEWSDKRQICVLNESKSGNAYARNAGMAEAHGEYLAFVDQDDYLDLQLFETLYSMAKEKDSDVLVSGYKIVSPNGTVIRSISLSSDAWAPYRVIAPWGKLYRHSMLKENEIGFLPVNKGEDIYFVLHAYNCAKRIDTCKTVGYMWVYNEKSLSHTEHRLIDERNSIIPLFNKLQETIYPLKGVEHDLLEYLLIKLSVREVVYCAKYGAYSDVLGYYEELYKWMNKYYPNNVANKYVSFIKPRGEELKRRIFVTVFWKLKYRTIKRFLYIYTLKNK